MFQVFNTKEKQKLQLERSLKLLIQNSINDKKKRTQRKYTNTLSNLKQLPQNCFICHVIHFFPSQFAASASPRAYQAPSAPPPALR